MALRQPRVLIADDSNTVHQLIRDSLPPDYSANVSQAYDGAVCLRALERGVDLAFIDVHMPTMGGMDALWAARIAGNKTFVTLMSGQADRRCIDLARRFEAYEFLAKPFGSTDIEVILATHRRVTAPMQVLLVDDSPVSVKVMRKVLDNSIFHLNIDHANTGREALEHCDASPFDVVFLDVNMPGLDGYATLPRLMQTNPRTKVVMISGERDALRERQALRLGAAAVMHKPFSRRRPMPCFTGSWACSRPSLRPAATFAISASRSTAAPSASNTSTPATCTNMSGSGSRRIFACRSSGKINQRRFRPAIWWPVPKLRPCWNWKMPVCCSLGGLPSAWRFEKEEAPPRRGQ